jgi:hypothetical protein
MLMLWNPAWLTSMGVLLTSPSNEALLGFNAVSLFGHGAFSGGSHGASEKERLQILQLAVDKSVKP